MMERMEAAMPEFVRRHVAAFVVLAGVTLVVLVLVLDAITNPESRAFRMVCRDLADQVWSGEATRFEYMATRCPAWMLVDGENAAVAGGDG